MSSHQSPTEVEQEHLQAMGPTLGPIYHALYNEVAWLHAKWLEYRKLFAKSAQRIDLLNETAGFFFGVVQDVLWKDVLLHIARLTDPAKQGKYENLTLFQLPNIVPKPELVIELCQLIEVAKTSSKFARDWRNKRLAHHDLAITLDLQAVPLPGVSRQHVEETLASFRAVLNHLHAHYFQSEVAFEHFLTHDDADTLVHHLSVAKQTEEQRRERLAQGRPLSEDFKFPPEV